MKHLARSTMIIAFFFGVDKILGFIRQTLVARQFSLSYELDVFNAANNIPDLLSALISGGALGVALIPVLSEYLEQKGHKDAWDLFSQILNLAFLVTAAISIILALVAPWFVDKIIVPGFPQEQKALTVELMRLDLIAIIIFSISGLIMAGLQANQHFLLPALAPGLYNIGQIFGATILSPQNGYQIGPITLPAFGFGIHGLVYGVIIGALLHLIIQVPGLLKFQFKWTPAIQLSHPGVRTVLSLMGPRVLTMFFIQLFFIVRDNLASGLGEGSVTALNLGWFIMQVPETLIGTAVAIALLPTISEIYARGDTKAFTKTVNLSIRVILALTIPIAVVLAIGIKPLVEIAFGFDEQGTQMVVTATRLYLLGLCGHSLLEIGARSFYAQQNAKIPLFAAALNSLAYIVGANFLSRSLGYAGIALTNSVVFTLEALLLLYLLTRKYPGIFNLKGTLLRLIPAVVLSSGITYYALQLEINLPLWLLSLAGMGFGLLLSLALMFPEIRNLIRLETKKTE